MGGGGGEWKKGRGRGRRTDARIAGPRRMSPLERRPEGQSVLINPAWPAVSPWQPHSSRSPARPLHDRTWRVQTLQDDAAAAAAALAWTAAGTRQIAHRSKPADTTSLNDR